jgi:uncharacterized protein (DUF885 family)
MRHRAVAVAVAALCACTTVPRSSQRDPHQGQEARRRFAVLLDEHWTYLMSQHPEFASEIGDYRFNDRWTDRSAAAVAAQVARLGDFLARFEALDPAGLSADEALTRELIVRDLRDSLEGYRLETWKMPVDQLWGVHLAIAQLPAVLPFRNVKDFDDYLARLHQIPRQLEDAIDDMRLGMAAGLMPPRYVLEMAAEQAAGIGALRAAEAPFARVLERLPPSLAPQEQQRIRAAVLAAVEGEVLPAYVRLARFVKEDYAPKGRTEPGIWALPDGAARYAFAVRTATTTRLTPDEIHELGLREVARIEDEMRAVAARAGYPSLDAFRKAIAADPRYRVSSREEVLETYRRHLDSMRAELPRLFGRLPRAELDVVPMEEFREKGAAAAEYEAGLADGQRPGRVRVNTGDYAEQRTYEMESIAYHEGIPGHHLQVSIQQELEGLPMQRRFWLWYDACGEGWALYAERLAGERGRYRDPANEYGHLQLEMLRAIRLVVDTGLHARRWSRDQVVRYFHDHSTLPESEIQRETDRYVVAPGQALAYKVGELEIVALRERARRALGPAFDLRAFHDAVLGAGSLPLDVLGERVDEWIAERRRP